MNKQSLIAACLGCALLISAPLIMADQNADNALKMSTVLEDLKAKGFSIVSKIEYDNGIYTAKAMGADGKEIKIKFNAQTGQIEKPQDAIEGMTALDIAKKVEDAGYAKIVKIDTTMFGDRYEVKAFDTNGKKIELKIDSKTGAVTKED